MVREVRGKKKMIPCKYCAKYILLLTRIVTFHPKLSEFKS